MLERHLETDELTTNVTEETTVPRVKSEIHVVSRHPNAIKIDKCRVFCQIPWAVKRLTPKDRTEAERLIDENFFQHFAQFGPMKYCYTVKDQNDRLSHGFVRYFNPNEASRALHLSKTCYRARRGVQQYSVTINPLNIIHIPCGRAIDRRNKRLTSPVNDSVLGHNDPAGLNQIRT